jgi:hypothetical protein
MSMWLRQEVQALPRGAGRRVALSWTAEIALLPAISIQAHSFGCFNFLTIRDWKTVTFVGALRQYGMTAPFVIE